MIVGVIPGMPGSDIYSGTAPSHFYLHPFLNIVITRVHKKNYL